MGHKHIFKNVGGGCLINPGKNIFPCDDTYHCKCGISFIVKSNEMGHRFLPEQFEVEEMSEVKKAEQNAILESKFNLKN